MENTNVAIASGKITVVNTDMGAMLPNVREILTYVNTALTKIAGKSKIRKDGIRESSLVAIVAVSAIAST